MTLEQIVEESRRWPSEKVSELMERLSADLHSSDPEIAAAWQTEIARRVEEIQSGKVQALPGEEVSARVRKIVGRRSLTPFTPKKTTIVKCLTTSPMALYDGNGNITGLINAVNSSTAARYEYSPFGELIRASGPMAKTSPFRFSTKFWDDESGLVYYGYRYYSPAQGRWIGRDPDGEWQGLNLYGFGLNSPIIAVDLLGEMTIAGTALADTEALQEDYQQAGATLAAGGIAAAVAGYVVADIEIEQGLLSDAMRSDNTTLEIAIGQGLSDTMSEYNRQRDASGLIAHIDAHVQKLAAVSSGGSPDPNDPNHDPINGWKKELKAAANNLKKLMKQMPNNAAKRQPLQDAINTADATIQKYGGLGDE